MTNKIYYALESTPDGIELYSIVSTNLGGPAKNYVTTSNDEMELHTYAESEGWELQQD
jgi:hypothetical protein